MSKEMVLVDDKGKRIDGRTSEESREIKIEAGVLKNADGSAYVEIGKNKVLAAVYGPRECHPRHLQNPTKAIVQCKYNMQAYSVDDRKRPGTASATAFAAIILLCLQGFTPGHPLTFTLKFCRPTQERDVPDLPPHRLLLRMRAYP
jgi:hypothetical protein